jgi:diaminopimelate decarboxylase
MQAGPTLTDGSLSTEVAALPWKTLDRIGECHGGSFYLADATRFQDNCRRFVGAFRARYPRTSIGYSYKTNYLPRFILGAHAQGAYSEVVSRFEFDYALSLGIPATRIIFNGPIKRREDLLTALTSGARVNVDSLPELHEAIRTAESLPAQSTIGIRCHLGSEAPQSRFGIALDRPEATAALAALRRTQALRLAGIHCHYSGSRGAMNYRDRIRAMIGLHRDVLGNCRLDYLDLGGGFASPMSDALASQLGDTAASYDDYAEAVATEMRLAYGEDGPELILEPGMGVLADTMVFVTRVETIKDSGTRRLAVVSGSVFNVKPLRGRINLPVHVVSANQERASLEGGCDIVGHTCMEVDVLHEGYPGAIAIDDYVVVENAGAYTNVLNAPFICGTPAIVEFVDGRPADVLRRASTVDDLIHSYTA